MTLSNLLITLDSTKITAQIYDMDGTTLLSEIKTSTYGSLEDELEARTVKSWSILPNNIIRVVLNEKEEETEP